ncbi:hypothetical protein [Thermobaculum terrenum]|uniref:hypothetical protein n=1 Tax=Thermobaculum terrenum TaxID=166501 RepID=UPI0002F765D7|nr:hypothetical protein [Thermobaculum terrenum]
MSEDTGSISHMARVTMPLANRKRAGTRRGMWTEQWVPSTCGSIDLKARSSVQRLAEKSATYNRHSLW